MKWKSNKILPPLHAESGYRESKRLLVFVADAGRKGEIAFGRCIAHGTETDRVYWRADGYSSNFYVSH